MTKNNSAHPKVDKDFDVEIATAAAHVRRLNLLVIIGGLVALVVLVLYFIQFHGSLAQDAQQWGQFGDYMGGVLNPTFSFLALMALLATLGMQIRELRLTSMERKISTDALVKQYKTIYQQTFEATFFQLLHLHNEIVTSLEVSNVRGRACFSHYLTDLEKRLRHEGATNDFDAFCITYNSFYSEYQSSLGHYFRLLYNLTKLVKRTDNIDRRFYTNLIRAQLSSAELKLLFYNCLSEWGSEKFKPLIEEFALLKTFPIDMVPSHELLSRYSPAAFGGKYPES